MQLDIYRYIEQFKIGYIGVPAGNTIPESWAGCCYFKTIDLQPDQPRIGMVYDANTVLKAVDEVGWSEM